MRLAGASYRIDETYIKVGKQCKYLYRAVDKDGNTIEFMLSAKRDVSATKRFFRKVMRADHRRLPLSINVDQHASYPDAFAAFQAERILPLDCKLQRTKYLTNVIEQDHRFIKKKARESMPPLVLHGGADARRGRSDEHVEEGASQKVSR